MEVYTARIQEQIDIRSGHIPHLRIGVFRGEGDAEEQIGEYIRNYGSFFNTFCPFQQNGKDYALYSPHYTATRIMELPSCRDIGGEAPSGGGFCPVDFYVPSYAASPAHGSWTPRTTDPTPEQLAQPDTGPLTFYPFGFVAGCVWGDDSSWKIQYLDLTQASQGIVQRDARFGYIILNDNHRLRDAVSMADYGWEDGDNWSHHIKITVQQTFDLRSGALAD